jgi:hypothetical protein
MPEDSVSDEEYDLHNEWSDAQENVAAASRELTKAKDLYDSAVRRVTRATSAIEAWRMKQNASIPVDRNARELIGGGDPNDPKHKELKPNGQQQDYVVLSAEERAKGFVRPVRSAYRHGKCGAVTTMSRALCETIARDPFFYQGTFCSTCCKHFPIGEDGDFIWLENDGQEIHKVGT